MEQDAPFVIAVASEKGGVGKTTIATNLAVYLKALREDLPVTIASFDNHFSVDQMFAIGRSRGASVSGLFAGDPAGELATLGEYGVQFLASDRDLAAPDKDAGRLRAALGRSALPGILILDTRPILDYFTRSALLAADLVLTPIKDRPSLVNAASLRRVLETEGGDPGRMWLIPSLVDGRLRLRPDVGVKDFLVFSARERGYHVVDTFISKSPKVESLTTNLTSRVYPVLTHARSTAVHGQFRDLANFVLQQFDETERPLCRAAAHLAAVSRIPEGRLRHLRWECPCCGERSDGEEGAFFQDFRSRRRGFLHPDCRRSLADVLASSLPPAPVLVFQVAGIGLAGGAPAVEVTLFDGTGERLTPAQPIDPQEGAVAAFLRGATGRPVEEQFREILVLVAEDQPPVRLLAGEEHARFAALRRKVVREALGAR
jgi:chromosome partitioning protein